MKRHWLNLALAILCAAGPSACNTAELQGPGGSDNASGGPPGPEGVVDAGGIPEAGRIPATDRDGGTVPASRQVTIQIQPTDAGSDVLAAIRGAKSSVHMTMYLLTNRQVIDALGDLKDAGKDVKVVLNQTFPPSGGSNTNAFNQLTTRGVSVVYAPAAYNFTHAKTVLIDNERLLVMTMNLTQSGAKENREFIATDVDPADVADAEAIFDADYTGSAVTVNGKLVVSPQSATPVDSRARLKALIDSASQTLDVEVQSLSDDAVTDAIVQAHVQGVKVRVVLASGNEESPAQKDSIAKLKQHAVPVVGVAEPYIHAKAIVVDNAKAFVGSQNFTPTGLLSNREIGVVTDAANEAAKVSAVIAKDFAAGSPL